MFLVTTAEESTWDISGPLVFLGEWCRKYSRRDHWQTLDAEVLPYHWDDRDKYNSDYCYLDRLYEGLLTQLSGRLGRLHGVTTDSRYWRIVVGPWLRFFVDAVFDRYEVVRTASEARQIDDTWLLSYDSDEWVPGSFTDFYRQYTNDPWNHILFAECIRAMGLPFTDRLSELNSEPARSRVVGTNWIRNCSKSALINYSRRVPSRLNRVALISSYLPMGSLAQFQVRLGQLPYPISPDIGIAPGTPVSREMRSQLKTGQGDSGFEQFVGKQIANWIPKTYVEDYSAFKKSALAEFPKRPRLIFTANAYQADDGFKVWAAEHCSNGVPLVIGQHGGNMGISHHNQTEDHQVEIANVFFSWGWEGGGRGNVQALPSPQLSNSSIGPDGSGDILLTLGSYPRYFYCHYSIPVAGQFLDYLSDQMQFIENLTDPVRSRLRIRLNDDSYGWDIEKRLRVAGHGGMIESGGQTFRQSLARKRLCISTYNGTVFLETLAANFPTLIFWNPRLFDIRPQVASVFGRLRDAGVLHETPMSAARLLNRISGDVAAWWSTSDVQSAREAFIHEYARGSKDWMAIWSETLKSVSREGQVAGRFL